MTNEIQIRSENQLGDIADPFAGMDTQTQPVDSIFVKIHQRLRGRYKWCLILGGALALGGAFFGARFAKVQYSVTGMVRVKLNSDYVLKKMLEGNISDFEATKDTQMALLKSQRVVELAMQNEEWVRLGRPFDDSAVEDFGEHLFLSTQGRSEVVSVTFLDRDKAAASAAIKGLLSAYSKIYLESENNTAKAQALENRRLNQTNELNSKRDLITNLANSELGADDLRPLHQARLQEKIKLEASQSEIEMKIATIEAAGPQAAPSVKKNVAQKPPQDMTEDDIELVDLRMRQLRDEWRVLVSAHKRMLTTWGPRHSKVVETQEGIDLKVADIARYAATWRAAKLNAPPDAPEQQMPNHLVAGGGAGPNGELSLDQLKRIDTRYKEAVSLIDAEMISIGRKMLQLEKLKREASELESLLAETKARIDQINIETPLLGRIQVVNNVDNPVLAKDLRVPTSIAGGIMGMMSGFGIVLLLALFDRRFRDIQDARTGTPIGLLGVLPSLPDDLSDPAQAAVASHCVHQIRTLLQIGHRGAERKVFSVTSPAAGTGKTSLTLSLGVSYAATNARTLIIDCDIMGGGLTARVDAIIRRKIGQILTREGLITPQQLDAALRLANNSQKKLGEALVELGMLSQEDVARALSSQEDFPVGVLDALAGEPLADCVCETGIANLYILPLGAAMPADVSSLAPAAVRRLVERAREQFDSVLIDTGPVPGSLEASVVAAASDAVIMVISRGDQRPLAERSFKHLQEIGATVAGMVFNRAEANDVEMSTTTNLLSSIDRHAYRASRQSAPRAAGDTSGGFGPVARAVTSRVTPKTESKV